MFADGYCGWVKTIEAVRLSNYRRLVKEIFGEGEVTAAEIGRGLGISKVYAWQLQNGKRDTIDSVAARKMERGSGKDVGWMDTDFSLWPFPDAELLAQIGGLGLEERIEIQGAIRGALSNLEQKRSKLSGKLSRSRSAAGGRTGT